MRPSEPEWPRETEPSPDSQSWQTAWESRVDTALLHNDSQDLASLFRELTAHLSTSEASELWMQKMSGWDSSAVTG